MIRLVALLVLAITLPICAALPTLAADKDADLFTRREDVIYGRKFGMALTMDVFTPQENANGAAVIWVTSGGWFSSREAINIDFLREPLARGYTVFAVMHGSQPKYTIPEAIADMQRSVRYIRTHADEFHIDPQRIGVSGGSAGGHLSLMLGMAGDQGNPEAKDPVDRASCRVQAVACYFPPTDFLNYGTPGFAWLNQGPKDAIKPPFDFRVWSDELRKFREVERRGAAEDRPRNLPHLSRHARRSAHADHPRRPRLPGAAAAVRVDHREAQGGRRALRADRQAGRKARLVRLARRHARRDRLVRQVSEALGRPARRRSRARRQSRRLMHAQRVHRADASRTLRTTTTTTIRIPNAAAAPEW